MTLEDVVFSVPCVALVVVGVAVAAALTLRRRPPRPPPPRVRLVDDPRHDDHPDNRPDGDEGRLTLSAYVPSAFKWKDKTERQVERVVKRIFFNASDTDAAVPLNINNVVGIEVSRAHFPRGMYQIDDHNRWLDIQEGVSGNTYSVQMDRGDGYSVQTFVAALQAKVLALNVAYFSGFTTAVVLRTSTMLLSNAGGEFTLRFATGPHANTSCYVECGFHKKDYVSTVVAGVPQIPSAHRVDLSGGRYLELFSPTLVPFVTGGILCQIGMQPGSRLVNYAPDDVRLRQYMQPIQVKDLDISIRMRRQGQTELVPYNFNGLWWSITLDVFVVRYAIPFDTQLDSVK